MCRSGVEQGRGYHAGMRLAGWLRWVAMPLSAVAVVAYLLGDTRSFCWLFLGSTAMVLVASIVRRSEA